MAMKTITMLAGKPCVQWTTVNVKLDVDLNAYSKHICWVYLEDQLIETINFTEDNPTFTVQVPCQPNVNDIISQYPADCPNRVTFRCSTTSKTAKYYYDIGLGTNTSNQSSNMRCVKNEIRKPTLSFGIQRPSNDIITIWCKS